MEVPVRETTQDLAKSVRETTQILQNAPQIDVIYQARRMSGASAPGAATPVAGHRTERTAALTAVATSLWRMRRRRRAIITTNPPCWYSRTYPKQQAHLPRTSSFVAIGRATSLKPSPASAMHIAEKEGPSISRCCARRETTSLSTICAENRPGDGPTPQARCRPRLKRGLTTFSRDNAPRRMPSIVTTPEHAGTGANLQRARRTYRGGASNLRGMARIVIQAKV